ncbi:MAG: LemA protein [uncultured bacterium]|nr:MAG: LemA protein [uncultured bacterium]
MKAKLILLSALFCVLVVGVISIILIINYNGIVFVDNNVEEAKGEIANMYQRRLDLIPNLVETVKGYAAHERDTLEAVINARNQAKMVLDGISKKGALSTEDIKQLEESQVALTSSIRGIFALVENYPDLKAASNFMMLQDQLEGTENRIAVSRTRYNSVVKVYNSKITMFPGVIIAPLFGYDKKEFFKVQNEEVSQAVKVTF